MEELVSNSSITKQRLSPKKSMTSSYVSNKQNQVGTVMLYGIPIVSLVIESQERLCLAQISNTLLKQYSYNEIHNRRVALGITCVQCTPVQLEILRRAGAMPVSSRRCGMITRREAERLCKSFLGDNAPPRLPDDFAFSVHHECAWGCRGAFLPSRYNSSRAKCIKCTFCGLFFSPNKFIFHSHRTTPNATYVQPDAANFNSWRRHMKLSGSPPDDVVHAWEDVKAMFNGGTRKRLLASSSGVSSLPVHTSVSTSMPITLASTNTKQIKLDNSVPPNSTTSTSINTSMRVSTPSRVPPFPEFTLPISMVDYVWHNGINTDGIKQFHFSPYTVPWIENSKQSILSVSNLCSATSQESILQHFCATNNSEKFYHHSAFRPVFPAFSRADELLPPEIHNDVIKRYLSSDELLLPKKKCFRESEKGENSLVKDFSEGENISCGISTNVEKNSVKIAGNEESRETYLEILSSNMIRNNGVKMTFKKEFSKDASDDGNVVKPFVKSRSKPDCKEIIDMSRLLSLKPTLLGNHAFKFSEFSPNLFEAITSLKAKDFGTYPGLTVKKYPDEENCDKEKNLQDSYEKKKTKEREDDLENTFRSEEEEENGGDDEPVDVETTDDLPFEESSVFYNPSFRAK